jgi:uncharacterized protein YabE (DUF348 family)
MKKRWGLALAIFVFTFLITYQFCQRPVELVIDGQSISRKTSALTVAAALQEAGFSPTTADQIEPSPQSWLGWNTQIRLNRAIPTYLFFKNRLVHSGYTVQRIPDEILKEWGLSLAPGDQLLLNNLPVSTSQPLPVEIKYVFQILPASTITLQIGEERQDIHTTASTVGEALWQVGIHLSSADQVTPSLSQAIAGITLIQVVRAAPLTIQISGNEYQVISSAANAGQALVDAGVSLQGLDYCVPAEDQPIPSDRKIVIHRVSEKVTLEEKTIPYGKELLADAELELDQRAVLSAGQLGLQITRIRTRFEDGVEIGRRSEGEWIASEPQAEKTGYGTKVAIHSLQTPQGALEYWREVPVYATSYSPCQQGYQSCSTRTASGMTLSRGVIAVSRGWYNLTAGQRVYVPGYGIGVIADFGGGAGGWIDLGFSEDDFEAWHQNTTLYFLTPVPQNIPWTLPKN